MRTIFAAVCVAACCMGNLPVPGECHGQLLNGKTAISSDEKASKHVASDHARRCGGGKGGNETWRL